MVTIPAQAPSYLRDFASETRESLFSMSTRVGVVETDLKRLSVAQRGLSQYRFPHRLRDLAANETLLVSDFDTVQIINCSSAANIVLMPPELGRWVCLLNVGTQTVTVKDGGTTLCTLPTNTLCWVRCYADSAFAPTWPTKVETWKNDGTLTLGVPLGITSGGTGLSALGTANQLFGMNAGASAGEWKTITGTTNRITVTHGAGTITLTTPQNTHTAASPTFNNLTLSARTQNRVAYFTTFGAMTDSANLTFNGNQLGLAATGSSGGVLIGADTQLYRSAADVLLVPDQLSVAAPVVGGTATTGQGLLVSRTFTPASGGSSGRVFGLNFSVYGTGAENMTDATGGMTGVEGAVQYQGTGTVTAMVGILISPSATAAGTITLGSAADFYGIDVSTTATCTTWYTLRIRGPRASGGGTIGTCVGARVESRTLSSATLTSYVGIDIHAGSGMYGFSANNQTRIGLDIGAIPDPAAYTGTTQAAIRIQGTNGTRDAILFSDVRLYRSASAVLAVGSGDLSIITAGKTLKIAEGTNCKMGSATLVGGTVTITTTAVTANSRIFLSNNANGGTVGALYVSARTAATSFVITSTSGTDTSTVSWLLLEPA